MQYACNAHVPSTVNMLQVLQFFAYMGMPHPYKAPLLLVEGPVLEEYAGVWAVTQKLSPMLQSVLSHVRGCLVKGTPAAACCSG